MFESCADEILAAMRRVTSREDIDLRSANQNNSSLTDNACK